MCGMLKLAVVALTLTLSVSTEVADGDLGGLCYPNDTCNVGMTCVHGTCRAGVAGADGQPCYGNGTCDAGLVCRSDMCGPDTSSLPECRESTQAIVDECVAMVGSITGAEASHCDGVRDIDVLRLV